MRYALVQKIYVLPVPSDSGLPPPYFTRYLNLVRLFLERPTLISTLQPYSFFGATFPRLAAMPGSWLNTASRHSTNAAMVPRLRVAVRVVSEDEYLTHLAEGPPGPSLYRGEKKFPIIIPNPQQWHIGHLAAEVKRQFKQLYGR